MMRSETARASSHAAAELGVEVGEGFVEEQDLGFQDDGAGDGDALLLAAGEFAGQAVFEAGEADEAEFFGGAGFGFGAFEARRT